MQHLHHAFQLESYSYNLRLKEQLLRRRWSRLAQILIRESLLHAARKVKVQALVQAPETLVMTTSLVTHHDFEGTG